jgi:hypothetical protein
MKDHGICITYNFTGDEAEWESVCQAFLDAIASDSAAARRFSYSINKAKSGNGRVHIGRWDTAETLAHVQSQVYFKTFAANVQRFGADTLTTTPMGQWGRSDGS